PRDSASWKAFVEVYGRMVYSHCRGRGLPHEDAEDVTQNVFAQVARAIRTFEYQPDLGRFRDWLGTVVRNEVCRNYAKKARTAARGGGDPEAALDAAPAREEYTAWNEAFSAHIFQAALARSRPHFRDDTWRAFELVWLENRPAEQVARELGQTIDWVYVAKSR